MGTCDPPAVSVAAQTRCLAPYALKAVGTIRVDSSEMFHHFLKPVLVAPKGVKVS